MSYIEIDFDTARRCAALIKARAGELGALLGEAPDTAEVSPEHRRTLEALCETLDALSAELLRETEALAAIDDRMKQLHHMTYDERSINHGEQ